jgi:sulfotransferase family protein
MKNNRLPNFLIVGTMKSGTSTLADYLNQNINIHIAKREIHFFNLDQNYSKGLSWYTEQILQGVMNHNESKNLLIGEKTPAYSYQPNCAERIKLALPNAKLIWIFRDPIKRAFSNYLHAKKQGAELLSFRQCVKKEKERIRENIFKGYVERSKYINQIERFLQYYKLTDMHFLLFEDLIKSPKEELNKIAEFLGVSQFSNVEHVYSNKTRMPFSPVAVCLTKKVFEPSSKIYKVTNRINMKLGALLPHKHFTISGDMIDLLEDELNPYNQRLSELTGLNLSSWQPSVN